MPLDRANSTFLYIYLFIAYSGEPAAGHISCDYVSDYGTSGSPVLKGNMVVGVNSGIEFGGIRNAIPVVDVCASLRLWSRIGEAVSVKKLFNLFWLPS